jgi:hypothetical protein
MAFGFWQNCNTQWKVQIWHFYKIEKVHSHCKNYRQIQWKYPGHRLYTKTLTTLRSKNSASLISAKSAFCKLRQRKYSQPKTSHCPFCNFHGTGKIIPNNLQRAELHSRHWSHKTLSDIRTINLGYIWQEQSLHHPIVKLCTRESGNSSQRRKGES